MTPEEEIKWLKEQNKALQDKINELQANRIHCRQCHSTNIKLTNQKSLEEFNTYEVECTDCSFKDKRYITHDQAL